MNNEGILLRLVPLTNKQGAPIHGGIHCPCGRVIPPGSTYATVNGWTGCPGCVPGMNK